MTVIYVTRGKNVYMLIEERVLECDLQTIISIRVFKVGILDVKGCITCKVADTPFHIRGEDISMPRSKLYI